MRSSEYEFSRRSLLIAGAAGGSMLAQPLRALAAGNDLGIIIARNSRARGGKAQLDRVRSLTSEIRIEEGGDTIHGRYAATTGGLVRIDIYADGKSVFSEGMDANGAWIWTGGEDPPKESKGGAALLNGATNHLHGWHRFAERGHAMKLMPPEALDGVRYEVVEVRYATGQLSYFYVDPRTGLAVRRRDQRAYHPDVDMTQQRVETRFSDFKTVAGILAPHRNEDFDLRSGKKIATHTVLARRINAVRPASYFDRGRRAASAW